MVTEEDKDKALVYYEIERQELKQQIRSLEEQLKKWKPKFKIGQEAWFISDPNVEAYRKVRKIEVEEISVSSIFIERGIMYSGGDWAGISENELFTTREEAERRLAELEGE